MHLAFQLALVAAATLLLSVVRRRVGGGHKRNLVMLAGTLGGLVLGAAVASPLSRLIHPPHVDVVNVCMFLGILAGWTIAWPIARRFPTR